jgi:methylenetetrahydrofolate reductase (NADPH)
LDVLNSGHIEMTGIKRISVAGYPEGHRAIGPTLLSNALGAKQAFAERTGLEVRVVTQFGLYGKALARWEDELVRHGVRLPIYAGIAGPMALSRLIHFAMICGIGASLRTVMRHLSASVGEIAELAVDPGQHVMHLVQLSPATRVVAPHFFSFGAAIETARWIKRVAGGDFAIDPKAGKLEVED